MSVEQNRTTAIKFLTGGIDASMVTDDFQWWTPAHGPMDVAKMKALVAGMGAIMPRLPEMTVVGVTAEGDRVAVEISGKCELTNGKRYDNSYHFLVLLRDGKIRTVKEYCDTKLAHDAFSES
jgi:ketosteroid isomerase-like protein